MTDQSADATVAEFGDHSVTVEEDNGSHAF
jgi:hypothetical protein